MAGGKEEVPFFRPPFFYLMGFGARNREEAQGREVVARPAPG